jgi:hypothetical protein
MAAIPRRRAARVGGHGPLAAEADGAGPEWNLELRYRETERSLHRQLLQEARVKLWPLSVSSDKIATCAWRCAALLMAHHDDSGKIFDRTGLGSGVFEVYPAARSPRGAFATLATSLVAAADRTRAGTSAT